MNVSDMEIDGMISRRPRHFEHDGISAKEASLLMSKICERAAVTGRTINASLHLDILRDAVAMLQDR